MSGTTQTDPRLSKAPYNKTNRAKDAGIYSNASGTECADCIAEFGEAYHIDTAVRIDDPLKYFDYIS